MAFHRDLLVIDEDRRKTIETLLQGQLAMREGWDQSLIKLLCGSAWHGQLSKIFPEIP